jgi:nicotinate phosphoribosyltransferase
MLQGYVDEGMDETAVFEFFVRELPANRNFMVAAGLQQVLEYLEDFRFHDDELDFLRQQPFFSQSFVHSLRDMTFEGDVDALPEGTVFFADEPVLRVVAPLPQAQLVETRLINLLQFETMIASKAARMKRVMPDNMLVDFGLRRAHAGEAGLLAARAAYLAGFGATSTVLAGKEFGIPISGTMAHSFVQAHENEESAFEHFAQSQPDNAVLLIDTYDTLEAAHKVVEMAPRLEDAGTPVRAVRIDSGDLVALSKSVRSIFDEAGLTEIKILVSGSLDEYRLKELRDSGAPIDGFGIGTKLVTSHDSAYLECAYKLQEYAGSGRRKYSQGKATWPGRKQVFREVDDSGILRRDTLGVDGEGVSGTPLLVPVMREGRRVADLPSLDDSREYSARQIQMLPDSLKSIEQKHVFNPVISDGLQDLTDRVDRSNPHRSSSTH